MISHECHPTSACHYGTFYHEAVARLRCTPLKDKILSNVSTNLIQLCPQHKGSLNPIEIRKLKSMGCDFQLHANVKLSEDFFIFDASSDMKDPSIKRFIKSLKAANSALSCVRYSYHAGYSTITMNKMFDNVKHLESILDMPVAVEGMYRNSKVKDRYLLSSYEDYKRLLDGMVDFALDLSHIKILAEHEGKIDRGLVKELLSSERCTEIHLSDNDGRVDSHSRIDDDDVWWIELLKDTKLSEGTLIFVESSQRK